MTTKMTEKKIEKLIEIGGERFELNSSGEVLIKNSGETEFVVIDYKTHTPVNKIVNEAYGKSIIISFIKRKAGDSEGSVSDQFEAILSEKGNDTKKIEFEQVKIKSKYVSLKQAMLSPKVVLGINGRIKIADLTGGTYSNIMPTIDHTGYKIKGEIVPAQLLTEIYMSNKTRKFMDQMNVASMEVDDMNNIHIDKTHVIYTSISNKVSSKSTVEETLASPENVNFIQRITHDKFFAICGIKGDRVDEAFELLEDDMDFKPVIYDKVINIYDSKRLTEGCGSCMETGKNGNAVEKDVYSFYEENGAKGVAVIDRDGKIRARAILWDEALIEDTGDVVKYLDRIYFNHSRYRIKLERWASAQGYAYRATSGQSTQSAKDFYYNGTIHSSNLIVNTKHIIKKKLVPYMDSFEFGVGKTLFSRNVYSLRNYSSGKPSTKQIG